MTETVIYPLKLSGELKRAALREAERRGLSLDDFISETLSETLRTIGFFRERAGDARPEDLLWFVRNAPDVPPDPGDELPPGWVRK